MVDTKAGTLPRELDGLSEIMVLSNYPDAKNIMLFGFDVKGPLDIGAMNSALNEVIESFPQFACRVEEKRVSGKWYMSWSRDPDFRPDLRVSHLEKSDPSTPFQRSLLRHLRQSIEKEWDLLRVAPTEFHAIRVGDDQHTLLALVHHAAADGFTLSLFFQDLLACYHRAITGGNPEWAEQAAYSARVKNHPIELKPGKWRDALFLVRDYVRVRTNKPSIPRGSGRDPGPGNHYVKCVLSREETSGIVSKQSAARMPFMDVLVAALGTAVDEWNANLNIPRGVISICVTVQMRGRFGNVEAPSNSSSVVMKFAPGERANPEEFGQRVSEKRIEQFDSLYDARVVKATETLGDSMRRLPLPFRQRIAHSLCHMPLIPMLIAPFGLMWPEIKDGRRTGDSFLTGAGGLDLTEFHAIPYKLGYHCPLILGAYTFRGRLNLQLMSLVTHYTSSETERFMDLLVKVILDRPFGAPANGFALP